MSKSKALNIRLEALSGAAGADAIREALVDAGFRVVSGRESAAADCIHLLLAVGSEADSAARTSCEALARAHPDVPLLMVTTSAASALSDVADLAEPFETLPSSVSATDLPGHIRSVCRRWHRIETLKEQAADLQQVEKIAELAHFDLDPDSRKLRASAGLAELLGCEESDKVPLDRLLDRVDPADRTALRSTFDDSMQSGTPFAACFGFSGADGVERQLRARGESCGRGGAHVFCVLDDITRHHDELSSAREQSRIDPLTGLGNRRFFTERLEAALGSAAGGGMHALLYLDLDRFKIVNDSLGHDAGDQLLRVVAGRLLECVRAEDLVCRSPGKADPTVSRLGGDEFTILLSELTRPEDAVDVASRIHRALEEPIEVGEHMLMASASVGIAVHPTDAATPHALLKRADAALYEAKRSGGAAYRTFAAQMEEEAIRRLRVETGLRAAIDDGAIDVHYQPRLDMAQRRISGVEALFRWESPELGRVSPTEAIHVAEETGLIARLGRRVLARACRDAAGWSELTGVPLTLSVNVSPAQFRTDDMREAVVTTLMESGLAPDRLELEITESLLLDDDPKTVGVIHELRSMGIRIALDDFGTGYSSLSLLARYPIDTLKLDRELVTDSDPESAGGLLLTNVLRLAHDLQLHAVAEGVSFDDQVAFLLERGCTEMQGFLFSRAIPNEALRTMLGKGGLP